MTASDRNGKYQKMRRGEGAVVLTDLENEDESDDAGEIVSRTTTSSRRYHSSVMRPANTQDLEMGLRLPETGSMLRNDPGRFNSPTHRTTLFGATTDQQRPSTYSSRQGSPAATQPSPVLETVEEHSPPRPIPVSYHDRSEISVEQRPQVNELRRPEEHKAQILYSSLQSK